MNFPKQLRESVRRALPEIEKIRDTNLRERVVDAWSFALAESSLGRIEDMPCSGSPNEAAIPGHTQADHLRGVALMAAGLADALESLFGPLDIDRDLLWAASLCHDVGKPFEYDPESRRRWSADRARYGDPSIRHSVYGVHVAYSVGLPEEIAHVCGAHSMEGQYVERSLICEIVHRADYAFWNILAKAGARGTGKLDKPTALPGKVGAAGR